MRLNAVEKVELEPVLEVVLWNMSLNEPLS